MYFVALIDGEVIGWVHLESHERNKLDGVVSHDGATRVPRARYREPTD